MITAAISPYRAIRDEARQMMDDHFVEVYVEVSVEVCEERDIKGLYAKARSGEIKELHRRLRSVRGARERRGRGRDVRPVPRGVGAADPHVSGRTSAACSEGLALGEIGRQRLSAGRLTRGRTSASLTAGVPP